MAVIKGRFYVSKIAKLFYKYRFFDDDLCTIDESAYDILCSVYNALDSDAKSRLHCEYDIVKSIEERRAMRCIDKDGE